MVGPLYDVDIGEQQNPGRSLLWMALVLPGGLRLRPGDSVKAVGMDHNVEEE
jgi:hypothetical protein